MNLRLNESIAEAKDINSKVKIESKPRKVVSVKDNKIDEDPSKKDQAYGTGRRKDAVARVWIKNGPGLIIINKKPLEQYFPNEAHRILVKKIFEVTKVTGQYNIVCTVKGGGCSGQAGAILHGTARALDKLVPSFHKSLRDNGFLTRDSRTVERKKYGRHKARKGTQFSKR